MEVCYNINMNLNMNKPSFCAIHQHKTVIAVKQASTTAFPNCLQSSMWSVALGTPCPVVISKYVYGGSRRMNNIHTHFTAAQDWTDEILMDEEDDDYEEESSETEDPPKAEVGDGEEGGGASLGGTVWGSKALAIAEEVICSFKDDLEIFAFKASNRGQVCVRLDKLSNKYGSPSIEELEIFSEIYSERLDEAKQAGALPQNLALEVSSPGADRVVRVPEDLERFKDLPMYVRYIKETAKAEHGSHQHDGIFLLDNIEMELGYCTWRLANVKLNRQLLGKGRSLDKKKSEWRLRVSTPGAERVVRVPKELERFKNLPMYVRYTVGTTISENESQEQDIYMMEAAIDDDGSQEHDGVFVLDNVEMELGYCTWKLANVRLNRELLGKGRSLNKKQREWRLRVPFTSLVLVRLYLDL